MAKLVVGVNDLQSKFPKIAEEWDYELNFPLTPDKITYGSEKKVFWKCKKGHSFKVSINNRTSKNSGCPVCAGKKILKGYNDLQTLHPEVSAFWNYEKNGDLTPDMVSCKSSRVVWWKCAYNHEWKASIYSRMKSGCPYCSGRRAIRGKTDLLTLYPKLCAEEWDYEKNGKLTPDLIKPQSHIEVWWRCKNNHSWKATPHHRINGTGCPICAKERMVSFPEKIIAYYLKKVLPIRENIFIDRWNVDILCDNIAIEYDGEYFHSKSVEKDDLKNKDLSELGFTVIRILGKAKSDYIKLSNTRYEICELNYDHFKQLISDLCNYLNVSCPDINVKRDKEKIKELLD